MAMATDIPGFVWWSYNRCVWCFPCQFNLTCYLLIKAKLSPWKSMAPSVYTIQHKYIFVYWFSHAITPLGISENLFLWFLWHCRSIHVYICCNKFYLGNNWTGWAILTHANFKSCDQHFPELCALWLKLARVMCPVIETCQSYVPCDWNLPELCALWLKLARVMCP